MALQLRLPPGPGAETLGRSFGDGAGGSRPRGVLPLRAPLGEDLRPLPGAHLPRVPG